MARDARMSPELGNAPWLENSGAVSVSNSPWASVRLSSIALEAFQVVQKFLGSPLTGAGTVANVDDDETTDQSQHEPEDEDEDVSITTSNRNLTPADADEAPIVTYDNTKDRSENEPDAPDEYYIIWDLVDHRLDKETNRVSIKVQWKGIGVETWEDEETLQEDAAMTLYGYWKEQGGRTQALDVDLFHVFRILDHQGEGTRMRFKCQWVGYPASEVDCSWEPKAKVKRIAEVKLKEYYERLYQGE
ncbi:hypothetical protein NM208_g668 [Fusarium decemcellulare]|uniref:Uncharacterized protein n=1 Tax=Fusarium decemcellulare TaxID=57161 RepID=A0ACC1SYJ1_9HYPO|nr:hypothetical protein NM208_g668 [Fusarium decemcellulare]